MNTEALSDQETLSEPIIKVHLRDNDKFPELGSLDLTQGMTKKFLVRVSQTGFKNLEQIKEVLGNYQLECDAPKGMDIEGRPASVSMMPVDDDEGVEVQKGTANFWMDLTSSQLGKGEIALSLRNPEGILASDTVPFEVK